MRCIAVAALVAGMSFQASALAAPTLTTDAAAFATATASVSFTTETFNGLTAGDFLAPAQDFGLFGVVNSFFILPVSSGFLCTAGSCLNVVNAMTFTFDSPVNAISFDISNHTVPYSVTVDGGSAITLPSQGAPGMHFVGIYDLTTPFTALTLSVGNGNTNVDNLSFGAAAAVTETLEPASVAVLATGLLGLMVGRRKQAVLF